MAVTGSARFESYLQFDAGIVEEAVLLAIAGHPEEPRFRRQRDRIYEIEDGEERERGFQEFHASWFQRLGLDRPLAMALQEESLLREKTWLCAVTPAASPQDEGADLYGAAASPSGADGAKPAIAIKLRPKTLLNTSVLLPFLRHELMHVADMLDPRFGYEPFLPQFGLGSSHDNLVRERYRILWDTWIDGRLRRRGLVGPISRHTRWTQFLATFPCLGPAAQEAFTKLYESDVQTHRALLEVAQSPETTLHRPQDPAHRARHCPLCRFPAYHFANVAELPAGALNEIAADYPNWRAEEALCIQCADLYRARCSTLESSKRGQN